MTKHLNGQNMIIELGDIQKKIASSFIDPRPHIWWNSDVKEWLTVWNGIEMLGDHAWILATTSLLKTPIEHTVIERIDKKVIDIYSLDEDTRKKYFWNIDDTIKYYVNKKWSIYGYYSKLLSKYIKCEFAGYSNIDVLEWFENYLLDNYE